MTRRVHLVEPGGRGGVHQHAVAVAEGLAAAGDDVVVHTARDAETDPAGISLCRCVRWYRSVPAPLRQVLVAVRYVTSTLPHVARHVAAGEVVHVQGIWVPLLSSWTIRILTGRAARTVFSPHNTFVRRVPNPVVAAVSRPGHLRAAVRRADRTIVFHEADADRVRGWGGRPVLAPLTQKVPRPDARSVAGWRSRWGATDGVVVLFAGQLRHDKGLDRAIRAAALGPEITLAVVGEDKGAASHGRQLERDLDVRVRWFVDYLPLPEFVAAVAAADVVLCPYREASQSGVLAVAAAVGTPSVATDVGGLGAQATIVVPAEAADHELLDAIRRARLAAVAVEDTDPVPSHHAAYGWARRAEDGS